MVWPVLMSRLTLNQCCQVVKANNLNTKRFLHGYMHFSMHGKRTA